MSVEVAHGGHAVHHEDQAHQFEDMAQQNESYIIGMWTFLVTEIMFFGALFLAYTVYRTNNSEAFYSVSRHSLNLWIGAINTTILLTSSWCMAMCVYNAQQKNRTNQLILLALTIFLAFAFLAIKGWFEWRVKFLEHHVPGPTFFYDNPDPSVPVQQGQAQMFFSLYFAMTGLHAVHVILGIVVMGVLWAMIYFRHPAVRYYMPVEMTGLYWHFVDIVWIFLYPLFYLIPTSGIH